LLFPDGLPVARIKLTADHIARRGKARQPGFFAGDPKTTLWQQAVQTAPSSPSPPPSARPSPPPPKGRGPV
jgi:hypothetical protein